MWKVEALPLKIFQDNTDGNKQQQQKKKSTATIIRINSSVSQFSHSVMSSSLRLHESQHARPPCPLPTPRVYSNSCPSIRWSHPAISSSVIPFSSCPQSLPKLLRSRQIGRVALTYTYFHGGPVVKNLPANSEDTQRQRVWFLRLEDSFDFLVAQTVKNLTAMQETQGKPLGQEDPLKKGMATYPLQYSCLENSMENPEMPGGLQSIGSQRVRQNWATNTTNV